MNIKFWSAETALVILVISLAGAAIYSLIEYAHVGSYLP